MALSKICSRKEISKILAKAAEIQSANEIYSNEDGLTESELLHIADEVGLIKESIEAALLSKMINSVSSIISYKQQQFIPIEEKEVYADTNRHPSTPSSHLKT